MMMLRGRAASALLGLLLLVLATTVSSAGIRGAKQLENVDQSDTLRALQSAPLASAKETVHVKHSKPRIPSKAPTRAPSKAPSRAPSKAPSRTPSKAPASGTVTALGTNDVPTVMPTRAPAPTLRPTESPSKAPTRIPTAAPSASPSTSPSRSPSASPSLSPTHAPTNSPSSSPSSSPSGAPTAVPSASPSSRPTKSPSLLPTSTPSSLPTARPSGSPSTRPTATPSSLPTPAPSPLPTPAPSAFSTPSSGRWVKRTDAGYSEWNSVAVSANGSQIVGESWRAPGLVTSPDGGSSWVHRNTTGTGVIISNDGRKLLRLSIEEENLSVFMSVDAGDSWKTILTPRAQTSGERRSVAGITATSDLSWIAVGMHITPSNAHQYDVLYTSQDGGTNWSDPTNLPMEGGADTDSPWAMASSSSGSLLVIARPGSPIFTSDDWGRTWVERVTTGSRDWLALKTSPDGQWVVAGEWDGWIHVSEDGGATWVRHLSAGRKTWNAVACSNDGRMLIACSAHGGYIYFSRDFGITWEAQEDAGGQHWNAVALSEDGLHVVASGVESHIAMMGYLYTYTFPLPTPAPSPVPTPTPSAFSTPSSGRWVGREGPKLYGWDSVALSANGSQIAVGAWTSSNLMTSPDGGSNWLDRQVVGSHASPSFNASRKMTISNDGRKIMVVNLKSILVSVDSGATWKNIFTSYAGERRCFETIAASSDMSWIVAGMSVSSSKASKYVIYTSQDGGTVWSGLILPTEDSSYSPDRRWVMASSGSGSLLVIARPGSPIYTSDDWGQIWVERVTTGSREWWSLTTSPDGQRVVAGEWDGYIHVSEDGGATWLRRTSAGRRIWQAVACSNGGVLIACAGFGDNIYFSRDFGITWERQDVAGPQLHWNAVALSEDGIHVVASGARLKDGMAYLYTYTFAS